MPIYCYECPGCQAQIEVERKITDDSPVACKVCGSRMQRLITKTSFTLRGSGWAKDGYSTPAPKKGSGSA